MVGYVRGKLMNGIGQIMFKRLGRNPHFVLVSSLLVVWLIWNTFSIANAYAAPTSFRQDDDASRRLTLAMAKSFELKVVGPSGAPVAMANVEVRAGFELKATDVSVGKFVRGHRSGGVLETNASGKVVVAVSQPFSRFEFFVRTDGFGPYMGSWEANAAESAPARFMAHLESAWRAGGIIVDESGQPIAGAHVKPSLQFKVRDNVESRGFGGGVIQTDKAGRWTYPMVPDHRDDLFVEVSHAEYMPLRVSLSRAEYEIKPGQDNSSFAKTVLKSGITVTGTIVGPKGGNVEGALVRTKFLNDRRQAQTSMDGTFELKGCERGEVRLVVSAPGFALDMKEVLIQPGMKPVDFQLQPGGRIRLKVVDENNDPIPNARIFFQRWRGRIDYFEFDHLASHRTDQNGNWEWNEAPLDAVYADICRPGGMNLPSQELKAGELEYVFRPPSQLYVSGKVVDDANGKPIPSFRVIPGIQSTSSRNLVENQALDGKEGAFRLKHLSQGYPGYFVRIESEGYDPVESRDFKIDDGEAIADFRLKRGKNITARVLTPEGKPAVGATVSIGVDRTQISIKNGRLDLSSTYNSPNQACNDEGEFEFPPRGAKFQLVILHDDGYAHVKSEKNELPERIILTPWATVRGKLMDGPDPESGSQITLLGEGIRSYGAGVPNIFTHNKAISGKDGMFVLDRVAAGEYRVGKRIVETVNDGAETSDTVHYKWVTAVPGETAAVTLGGTGRTVIGKLEPSLDFEGAPRWGFARIKISLDLVIPKIPFPDEVKADQDKRMAWLKKWLDSPEGQTRTRLVAMKNRSATYTATVAPNGSFRITDLPPGEYLVDFVFYKEPAGQIRDYRLVVDPSPKAATEPVDLGTITLLPIRR